MSIELLTAFLEANNIPLHEWGTGVAKTLNHLLAELDGREADIVAINGKVIRSVPIAAVDVYFTVGWSVLWLYEVKQVFADGRERKRELSTSLGEKMRVAEGVEAAARRALSEELKIHGPVRVITYPPIKRPLQASQSYPGTFTAKTLYPAEASLSLEQFVLDGYVEQQPDKTSFFDWMLVDD